MASRTCSGDGECLIQCGCSCYDEERDIPLTECTCGHRAHIRFIGGNEEFDVYCRHMACSFNCQLIECHNFRICGKKYPQRILWAHNGMCVNCAVSLGKIKFLDESRECPICIEHKDAIEISCNKHTICLDCWKSMAFLTNTYPLRCPLCRESIWKWKGK